MRKSNPRRITKKVLKTKIQQKMHRNNMENTLGIDKKNLNSILGFCSDSICILDKDLNIIWANKFAKKIFGNNIVNKKCYEVYKRRNEPCEPESCPTIKTSNDGKTHSHKSTLIDKNGKTVFSFCKTNVFLRNKNKTPIAIIKISKDITQRKQIEEALDVSERKYRDLADSLPQIVFEIDLEGNFKYINRHGFNSTGYTQEDIENGLNAFQLFIPEDRSKVRENIKKIISGVKSFGNEYTALRKDGSKFPVIVYSSPVINGNKITGLRGIVVDITEYKRAEEILNEYRIRINQAERLAATGRLAASVAHEINNPLQSISINLAILQKFLKNDSIETHHLKLIKEGIIRIKKTVTLLLFLHRKEVHTKEKINVNEIIVSTLSLLESQLAMYNIRVEKNLLNKILLVVAIEQDLFHAFINIIMNAQDAMENGGILRIATNVRKNKIFIDFIDDGTGISEKDIEHIFEPFFTTKHKKLGTGLGLSIAKSIIESFEGKIEVKSKVGEGSTFTIILPIADQ